MFHVMRQHFEVLGLLYFYHLDESLAHLPVVPRDVLVLVQSNEASTLFLKHDIQLADAIDRVGLLPHGFQIGFFLQARRRVS